MELPVGRKLLDRAKSKVVLREVGKDVHGGIKDSCLIPNLKLQTTNESEASSICLAYSGFSLQSIHKH